MNEVVLITS